MYDLNMRDLNKHFYLSHANKFKFYSAKYNLKVNAVLKVG